MWVLTVNIASLAVIITILYNLFVFVKFFKIYRFSWGVNKKARWLPLLPFAGNAYVALFTGLKGLQKNIYTKKCLFYYSSIKRILLHRSFSNHTNSVSHTKLLVRLFPYFEYFIEKI